MSQWPIVVPARLEGGKLVLNRERLAAHLQHAKDGAVTITIERARATRSAAQNAWYFGQVLKLISEHTGSTVDELHELMKLKFNAKQLVLTNGHGEIVGEERIGLSTTRLNKLTFGEYCEQIRIWAAQDLGLYIPDPDPDWRLQTHEVSA